MPGRSRKVYSLIRHFGSAKEAWEAGEKDLEGICGIGDEALRGLAARKSAVDLVKEADKLRSSDIEFICCTDPNYPENLSQISDPPPVIFVRGNLLVEDKLSVAVVGSRRATSYGLAAASKLACSLAEAGLTVVSGLARGIDTAAHRGALAASGRTIAVLGCGVDVIYPKENAKLMEEIIKSGAVISEFPPRSAPEPWHFPVRNRIISGLSLGVVIVEAAEKSGALITADLALEQGREVMAVPGSIASPLSKGPHRLIKQGAKLVEGAEDVLEELALDRLFPPAKTGTQKIAGKNLSPEEEALYAFISFEPVSLDSLVDSAGLTVQQVLFLLTHLELKGLVRQLPGKFYVRTTLD